MTLFFLMKPTILPPVGYPAGLGAGRLRTCYRPAARRWYNFDRTISEVSPVIAGALQQRFAALQSMQVGYIMLTHNPPTMLLKKSLAWGQKNCAASLEGPRRSRRRHALSKL
ncbi:hypothetical protein [Methylobacterium pseudosasicola]|uniref:hypothetical protein n=1 Tax=Methylobacterium pseudosasicola TaxID=582667 RepID=UPI001113828D|nr:hypothetical protein [Methylobacterium pseudosasicola]